MSELKHLRCDRCTEEEVFDPDKDAERFLYGNGWARIQVGSQYFDLCPNCWNAILLKEGIGKSKTDEPA